MAFTTWQALKDAVLDDIAAGNMTLESIGIKNRARAFRSPKELEDWLEFLDKQIAKEAGTYSKVRAGDVSLS